MKQMVYGTFLVAFLLVSCQQAPDSRAQDDLIEIRNQLKEFEEILLSPGVPNETLFRQYLEYYVDDLVLFPPGDDAVVGYEAALAYYIEGFGGGTLLAVDYHTQEPDVFLNGDMAIRRYVGTSEARFDGLGEYYVSHNVYIDVLQRQPNGAWRTVWHSWSAVEP